MFWSNSKEPLRRNRWILEVLHEGKTILKTDSLKECTKPSFKVSFSEHKLLNNTYKYPTVVKWSPVTIKFVDIDDGKVFTEDEENFSSLTHYGLYKNLEEQSTFSKIVNLEKQKTSIDVTIKQLNENGSTVDEWSLKNAFVSSLEFGSLTYESEDLVEVTAELQYDWAENTTYEDVIDAEPELFEEKAIDPPHDLDYFGDDATSDLTKLQQKPAPVETRIQAEERIAAEKAAKEAKEAAAKREDLERRGELAKAYDEKATRAEEAEARAQQEPTEENLLAAQQARQEAQIAESAYKESLGGDKFDDYELSRAEEEYARQQFEKNPTDENREAYKSAVEQRKRDEQELEKAKPTGEDLKNIQDRSSEDTKALYGGAESQLTNTRDLEESNALANDYDKKATAAEEADRRVLSNPSEENFKAAEKARAEAKEAESNYQSYLDNKNSSNKKTDIVETRSMNKRQTEQQKELIESNVQVSADTA